MDPVTVARELARECFEQDPALQKIEFDFLDCNGSPWIMLTVDGESESLTVGNYSGPSEATGKLDGIGDDLFEHLDRSESVVFTRAEVLGEVPA